MGFNVNKELQAIITAHLSEATFHQILEAVKQQHAPSEIMQTFSVKLSNYCEQHRKAALLAGKLSPEQEKDINDLQETYAQQAQQLGYFLFLQTLKDNIRAITTDKSEQQELLQLCKIHLKMAKKEGIGRQIAVLDQGNTTLLQDKAEHNKTIKQYETEQQQLFLRANDERLKCGDALLHALKPGTSTLGIVGIGLFCMFVLASPELTIFCAIVGGFTTLLTMGYLIIAAVTLSHSFFLEHHQMRALENTSNGIKFQVDQIDHQLLLNNGQKEVLKEQQRDCERKLAKLNNPIPIDPPEKSKQQFFSDVALNEESVIEESSLALNS